MAGLNETRDLGDIMSLNLSEEERRLVIEASKMDTAREARSYLQKYSSIARAEFLLHIAADTRAWAIEEGA